jgi:succinoglycan biosynthesis protein ExoW
MSSVAVIIPFFQMNCGILRRSIDSILQQRVSQAVEINVIVVDDGSPVSAASELTGLRMEPPFTLTLLRQDNHGVANARNNALRHVRDETDYVAFLDSDDAWHELHLDQAMDALGSGYDLYFTNHRRRGFHNSHFADHCRGLSSFREVPGARHAFVEIPRDSLIALLLDSCPIQISTLFCRRSILPDDPFLEHLKVAGEDVSFFIRAAQRAERCCANTDIMVDCGRGINIYFSRIAWEGDNRIRVLQDRIRAYTFVVEQIELSRDNILSATQLIAELKRDLVFFVCRYAVRERRLPADLSRFGMNGISFALWFAATALGVSAKYVAGLYRPRPG